MAASVAAQTRAPFQTGCIEDRDTPRIATSGALTIGVNAVPPIPPRLDISEGSTLQLRGLQLAVSGCCG